jgi:hypothetical protein
LERLNYPRRRYFDYQLLVQMWKSQFPEATIRVRPFNTAKRLPQGVITDFASVTNVNTDGCAFPHRVNTSFDAMAVELLRLVNCGTPRLSEKDTKVFKSWLRRKSRKDARLAPQLEVSQRFQAVYDHGNSWIIETYLPDSPSALTPNWDALSQASVRTTLSVEDAVAAAKTALEEHGATRMA